MEWQITDAVPAGRLYTRALVGELCPGAMTPMTATAGVGAELAAAWRAALGGPEADPHPPVVRFGAHLYFDTVQLRAAGDRLSGADPLAFSRQYLGERADVPRPHNRCAPGGPRPVARRTDALLEGWRDAAGERAATLGRDARRGRPTLAEATDAALVQRIVSLRPALAEAVRWHARAELGTAVASELLERLAEQAGQPLPSGFLVAAGPTESPGGLGVGGPAGTVVDRTVGPLWGLGRLTANGDTRRHRDALRTFTVRFGYLGGSGWELSEPCWETDPRLLTEVLEVLRRVPDAADPAQRAARASADTAELVRRVRSALRRSPAAATRFATALAGAHGWLRAREAARHAVCRIHHEQRMAARELGDRAVRSGVLDDPGQIFMLRLDEFDGYLAEPADLGERLRMRSYDHRALAAYRPPFATVGPPPPPVRWPRRDERTGPAGARPRPLPATPTSPGRAAGPARLPRDPSMAASVRPGDVLVLPTGGSAWTPLVLTAAAVVVEAGSPLSDVAVLCRDLGIPCVVACPDATRRITEGGVVTVDAATGTVEPAGRLLTQVPA